MFKLPSLLVVGAQGQLGYEIEALAREDGFEVTALGHDQLDLLDDKAVAEALARIAPQFVINAAAVLQAGEPGAVAYAVNNRGAAILAEACHSAKCALVHISCAEVFGGDSHEPFDEEYETHPQNRYAKSKLRGEQLVRAALKRHLIVRTSWLFSARGESFVRELLERARHQTEIAVSDGLQGAPTSAADLARVVLAMIKQLDCGADSWGTYHYCASESISWFGFAESIIAAARQYEELVLEELVAKPPLELNERLRPANCQLNCDKILDDFGIHQRSWRTGLMQVVRGYYSWTP